MFKEKVILKTEEEIELLRESALIIDKALSEVAHILKPGVSTAKVDALAEEVIKDHGAVPGFKGYGGFPATLCISINDEVVHGIPGKRIIKDGDIVSIDCGTILNNFYGDSAYTFAVGEVHKDILQLLQHTKASLYKGIEQAVVGKRIGDIGFAVQSYVEPLGYGVVRDLVGHGLGRSMHEEPQVPNYGRRGSGQKLRKGMVIAIEPMITLGTYQVKQDKDGWTIRTRDGKVAAHFEHDVAIGEGKADILSSFETIEKAEKANNNLN